MLTEGPSVGGGKEQLWSIPHSLSALGLGYPVTLLN